MNALWLVFLLVWSVLGIALTDGLIQAIYVAMLGVNCLTIGMTFQRAR